MEHYSKEIANNIKEDPEEHNFFEIPAKQESKTSDTQTCELRENPLNKSST